MRVPVVRNSVEKEKREEKRGFYIYQKMGTNICLKKNKNEIALGEKNQSESGKAGLYLGGQLS